MFKQNKFFTLLFLLTIVFCISSENIYAQKSKKKKKKKSKGIELNFSLTTIYDDNILKYSDKYLDKFENNEDEGRFQINTYDDIAIQARIDIDYTKKIFGKRKSIFDADVRYKVYTNNPIKNWGTFGFGFRQYITRSLSFKLYYSYISDFYINNFRDDDWVERYGYTPETFQPYSFTKDNFGFYIQETFLKKTRLKFTLNFVKYYHNEHFTEYDCSNFVYNLKVYQPITKKLKLAAAYQFTKSDAKGYDESFETKDFSDDSDATHDEDLFSVELSYSLPKIKKNSNSISFESRWINRYYTTLNNPKEDKIHAGRYDKNLRLYLDYEIRLNRKLKLSAFYHWYKRNTTSAAEENKTLVSDEKSYNQNQIGIKINYTLKY